MQDQAAVTQAYDLGHYLRPLRRHRALVLLFVLGGLVLGAAYTLVASRSYTSAASVNVNAAPVLPGQASSVNPVGSRTSGAVNLDTEAQVVKSSTVLERASTALPTHPSVGDLRGRIDVTVPPNSTILRIACSGRSPASAQACAAAVATAYLGNRSDVEKADIASQLAVTRHQIATLTAQIRKDTAAIVAAPSGSQARSLAFTVRQSDINNRNSLNSQINQLSAVDVSPGNVISAAGPGTANAANRVIPPLTGLVLGAIAGAGVVAWRERRSRFVSNPDDLVRYGVAVIADLEPAGGKPGMSDHAARTRFDQRVASLVAGAFDAGGGVVYVAAVSPGQADDSVAEGLAATLASVGHHVEIFRPADVELADEGADDAPIDALPEPAAPRAIGTGELGWPGAAHASPVEPTPAIPVPEVDPSDSPVPMTIRQHLEVSRRRAQFVVIDAEPAATDAQAYVLAGLSDAAVLVVDPAATAREDLAEVVDQIEVTGSELLGAVIWRSPRRGAPPLRPPRERTRGRHDSGRPGTRALGTRAAQAAASAPNGATAADVLPSHRVLDAGR